MNNRALEEDYNEVFNLESKSKTNLKSDSNSESLATSHMNSSRSGEEMKHEMNLGNDASQLYSVDGKNEGSNVEVHEISLENDEIATLENIDINEMESDAIKSINRTFNSLHLESNELIKEKLILPNIKNNDLQTKNDANPHSLNDCSDHLVGSTNFRGKEDRLTSSRRKSDPIAAFVFCKTPEKSDALNEGARRCSSVFMSFPTLDFETKSNTYSKNTPNPTRKMKTQENELVSPSKKRKYSEMDGKVLHQMKRSKRRRKTTFVWDQKENEPSTPVNSNIPKTPEADSMNLSFSPGLSVTETPKHIDSFGIFFADSDVQFKVTPFQNRKPMGGFLIEDSETPPQSQEEFPIFPDLSADDLNDPTENSVSLLERRRRKFDPYANEQDNQSSFNLTEFLEEKKRKRREMNAQLKAKKYGHAASGRFPTRESRATAPQISTPQNSRKRSVLHRASVNLPLTTPKSQNDCDNAKKQEKLAKGKAILASAKSQRSHASKSDADHSSKETAVATMSRLSRLATPKRVITPPSNAPQYCRSLFSPTSSSKPSTTKNMTHRGNTRVEGKVYTKSPSKIFNHLRRKSTTVRKSFDNKNSQPSLLKAPTTRIPDGFRALSEVKVSVNYERRRQERLLTRMLS